jgi:ribosomal protein S18 acetylase RimI-like enzyme
MSVTRRPATDSDADFAREAHHKAYHDVVVRQFGAWDESAQDSFFNKDWSSAEHEILLCDGAPRGYVSVEEYPDYIHVRELVVPPEYRGRGIGSSFLSLVLEQATARQVPVRLGVLHENHAASLYRRLGFREYDRTETHILMQWDDND